MGKQGAKRKLEEEPSSEPDAYVIEGSRSTELVEYDEDLYVDCDDVAAAQAVEEEIEGTAKERDGHWVFKDGDGNVLVFRTLAAANQHAATIWEQMQQEEVENWAPMKDEDVESDVSSFKTELEDGRVRYERTQQFYMDSLGSDHKNEGETTTMVEVVPARLL